MSPDLGRAPQRAADKAAERAHERARMFASDAIGAALAPADAAWLAKHLSDCADCQSVADEYCALHDELRGLELPEVPRDLWARTSASLDAIDRSRAGSARRPGLAGLGLGAFARSRSSVGSVMAVAMAVVVVGLSLLSQGPLFIPVAAPSQTTPIALATATPSGGTEAALAVVDGTSYWVAPDNGVYQIRGSTTHCTGSTESCAVTSGKGTVVGSIESKTAVSVVISSNATQAAVWNNDRIVILPLTESAPSTVSIDLLTPKPTTAPATTAPATMPPATAPPEPTPSPTTRPTRTPAARTAEPTTPATKAPPPRTPSATVNHTQPGTSGTPGASATATPQPAVTPAPPTPAPTTGSSAASAQPTAILDGYRIVGGNPQFSADGLWIAFSARRANLSTGSDVFVWRVGWAQAEAVTSSHSDLFAGWLGSKVLISEFSESSSGSSAAAASSMSPIDATTTPAASTPARTASATSTSATSAPATTAPATTDPPTSAPAGPTVTAISYLYDPLTSGVRRIDRPMLMPVVDPTGRFVVYWAGSVGFNATTGLYGPAKGDFYFDAWTNLHLVAAHLGDGGGVAPTPEPTVAATATPTSLPQPGGSASPDDAAGVAPSASVQPSAPPKRPTGLPQLVPVASAPGTVTGWSVRWDSTGQYVAIWVADAGATDVGQVTLLDVVPDTHMLNVDGLLLSAPARSNIQFDDSQFVYTSTAPGGDARTYLFALPAIPPAPPVAPESIAPPAGSGSGRPTASVPPSVSTDRPGS